MRRQNVTPLPPFPNLSDNLYIQDLISTTPNQGHYWYMVLETI